MRVPGIVKIKDVKHDDKASVDKLWMRIVEGDLDKVVDCFAIAVQFNLCLISAMASKEDEISHIGVVVPTASVFPKQTLHVRSELREYAQRVVGNIHKAKVSVARGIVTTPFPESMTAPVLMPSAPMRKKVHLVGRSSSSAVAAQAALPSVPAPGVLPLVPAPGAIPPVPVPASAQPPPKGANTCCVECGGKKKHTAGCVFDWWRNQEEKPELGPSLPPRSRGVSRLDHLRHLFVENREAILARFNSHN